MKRILKSTFILFVVAAVIASSTGVTLFKMNCESSGNKILSFNQIENCCSDDEMESNNSIDLGLNVNDPFDYIKMKEIV